MFGRTGRRAARRLCTGHVLLAGLLALSATQCVGRGKRVSEAEKQRLAAYVLTEVPAGARPLNIDYDGRVRLVGYRIEPGVTVKPGQQVTLTLYWKAVRKLESGWNLFTHVIDGAGERVLNIDNVGPLREWRESGQVLGPSQWETGKIYADEQSFTIPASLNSSTLQVVTGIWKDADRLPIVNGPKDGENRGIVTTLNAANAAAAPPSSPRVPVIRADKLAAGASLKMDGKLDEAAWQTAPTTGPFVDVTTGRPNTSFPVNGSVKLLWDDTALYLAFDVKDPNVVGGFPKGATDPHLWTQDTVEIMVDPDGNGDNKDYYEIQINPQNLVFDSRFDAYNEPKTEPNGPFGHQDWSAALVSGVTVKGTLDQPDDRDQGYIVEAKIPWKSFVKAKRTPPALGETWRMNFYAMQENSGVAWSPILGQGNFHKAARFGRVLFAERGWEPVPPRNLLPVPSSSAVPRRVPNFPGAAPLRERLQRGTPPATLPSAR